MSGWRVLGTVIGLTLMACVPPQPSDLMESTSPQAFSHAHVWSPEGSGSDDAFIMVVTRTLDPSENSTRRKLPVHEDYIEMAGTVGYQTRPVHEEDFRASLPVILVDQVVESKAYRRPPRLDIEYRSPQHPAVVRFYVELAVAEADRDIGRFGKEVLSSAL